ncbi:DUF6531 domain-containing protein [Saccharothrix sp. NRRL B-16314]|uniref:DUF6531 domain-containing protein n=1 Tax=Saccharothrix sp. NRRL B-16314 TaxID=1463825 RepID=UPI003FA68771
MQPDSPNQPADSDGRKTPESDRVCENDPVDIASGDVVLGQTDVDLAGVLPPVLRRTSRSTGRARCSAGAGRARSTSGWRSTPAAWCSSPRTG